MFQHKRINAGFGVFEVIDGDFSDTVLSNGFGKIGYGFEALMVHAGVQQKFGVVFF